MPFSRGIVAVLLAAMLLSGASAQAGDANQDELNKLKKELDDIRAKLDAPPTGVRSRIDQNLESKYGPNAAVTTRTGKLVISGMVQVWYYSIENDNKGLFDSQNTGIFDTNEAQDNDSFRIRRTELKFTIDVNENITGVIMIDPAREATSFPDMAGSNQGLIKRANQVAPEFNSVNGPGLGSTASVAGVQSGSGGIPRLLQDAYVNYHGVIPHHDFQLGQFKPPFGEEGIRNSAQLDFVERSMLGQIGDNRDLGMQVHGTWWDDRFQYWGGMFNGSGNYYLSGGQYQNRSNDNDSNDFVLRALIRPLWKDETWGSIELGGSSQFGHKGEASGRDPINAPINGLNRNETWAIRHAAWASYLPGGPVRGLWLRGEWMWIKDRHAPGTVVDLTGSGGTDIGNTFEGTGLAQSNGKPFISQGWYAALGYKLSDSRFCDSAPGWLKPFEFAVRYQTFENVHVADLVNPAHTDNFSTNVWTAGMNYYIKGHDAKIQLNYNVVDDPEADNEARDFHEPANNSLIVSFQVAF